MHATAHDDHDHDHDDHGHGLGGDCGMRCRNSSAGIAMTPLTRSTM
jgi:hypothetical protein